MKEWGKEEVGSKEKSVGRGRRDSLPLACRRYKEKRENRGREASLLRILFTLQFDRTLSTQYYYYYYLSDMLR
jgi:hypothetical protein